MAHTPTAVNVSRQTVLSATREFNVTDLVSTVAKPMIYLKPGTRILRGFLDITEAFNSTSTDVIDVGDTEGTDDPDRYTASAINVHTTGLTALTVPVTNGVISTAEAITIEWTSGGGTPTAGAGVLHIEYIEDDRSTEYHTYRG